MRRIGIVTALALTAGCAQILGVDEDWERPTTSSAGAGGKGAGGADGSPATSATGTSAPTTSAAGSGGAGGADCPGVNTQTDPANCGACGHDCQGGECLEGVCRLPMRIYGSAPMPPDHKLGDCNLIVDGDYVYLAVSSHPLGKGVVTRFLKNGSELEGGKILAQEQRSPFGLAVDDEPDGYLYFANLTYVGGDVVRVKKGGGGLLSFGEDIGPYLFLAHAGDKLFVTSALGELREFDLSGDFPVESKIAGAEASALAVDGAHVYWLHRAPDSAPEQSWLRKRALGGGLIADVAKTEYGSKRLALGGGALYFSRVASKPGTAIKTVPVTGGVAQLLHAEPQGVWSLAADESHVYWTTNSFTTNAVRRMPKGGLKDGPVERLADTGATRPVVALDDEAIYWCAAEDEATLSVFKLAK